LWAECNLNVGNPVDCDDGGGGKGKGGGGTATCWDNTGTAFHFQGPVQPMGFLADVFAAPGAVDVDDLSMIQVLWEMPGSFASFAVAAYLNACSSVTPTYPLSPTEIQAQTLRSS
jgi:hypothetical protein